MDYFFCKIQKILFWGCFGALSPKWDFFPKIWLCQFFTLKTPSLHEKFQKNPMRHFENVFTYWHSDIMTVVKSQGPFLSKGRGQTSRNWMDTCYIRITWLVPKSLFGHAWTHPSKLTWSIYNFNGYEAACTKSTLYLL